MNLMYKIMLSGLTLMFILSCSHEDHEGHNHGAQDHSGHGAHEDNENDQSHDDHESQSDHGEHGHEEASAKFGEHMAITWVDEETDRFELSDRLVDLVKMKRSSLKKYVFGNKRGYYLIPKSAFVEMKDDHALYKIKDNKVKLFKVQLLQKKPHGYLIFSKELFPNESVVLTGVSILRVAELQVFGEGGHGHAH